MRLFVSCVPFDDGRSGISVYIRNVIRELAAQGHDLTLLVESGMSHHFNGFSCVSDSCCIYYVKIDSIYYNFSFYYISCCSSNISNNRFFFF